MSGTPTRRWFAPMSSTCWRSDGNRGALANSSLLLKNKKPARVSGLFVSDVWWRKRLPKTAPILFIIMHIEFKIRTSLPPTQKKFRLAFMPNFPATIRVAEPRQVRRNIAPSERRRQWSRRNAAIPHGQQGSPCVRAGERVIIASGTYRECVRSARCGSGPTQMISYEAAQGTKVFIKGSEILKDGWQRELLWRGTRF